MANQSSTIFRVRAHNAATDSENKIHDDQVAASLGFRGGLVPGVTVYGYMIPPVLEVFGLRWLESGSMNMRLFAPCYEGETVVSSCDGSVVSASHEDGSLYASGTVTIDDDTDFCVASLPMHPLPEMDQRPVASSETILPGLPLGTIQATLDVEEVTAIPERLLRMANDILVRNFRMSPWIHAGSHVRHQHLAALGQEITVRGVIQECFERKGRKFAVAGLQMTAGPNLVATVRHTFIYQL
ncbi:MAG TPA: hypothetical protein VG759_28895 [Candidatus Angelobacter sp.]|nr:hypothetical protein [Candidatus Angelobacter sp.]